jgi:hypothetical protein
MLQLLGLVHRSQRGGLVGIPDRDQVRHLRLLARRSAVPVAAGLQPTV